MKRTLTGVFVFVAVIFLLSYLLPAPSTKEEQQLHNAHKMHEAYEAAKAAMDALRDHEDVDKSIIDNAMKDVGRAVRVR